MSAQPRTPSALERLVGRRHLLPGPWLPTARVTWATREEPRPRKPHGPEAPGSSVGLGEFCAGPGVPVARGEVQAQLWARQLVLRTRPGAVKPLRSLRVTRGTRRAQRAVAAQRWANPVSIQGGG